MSSRILPAVAFISGCAVLSAFGQPRSPAAPDYSIAGVVVEHATNRPVDRVLVVARAAGAPDRQTGCLTDSNGTFRLEHVPPGKYTLTAEGRGGMPQQYHASEGFVTGISVGPGRDSEHIVFELSTGAKLSGTVTNQDGEPIQRAQVYVFRKGVFAGSAGIRPNGIRMTDSAGRFHFSNLPAGTYLVAASAQPWYLDALSRYPSGPEALPPEMNTTYPITYYSGALDAGSASAISLGEGASTSIQMVMQSVPAVNVTLDQPAEPGEMRAGVEIAAAGPGGFPIMIPARGIFRDGHYELLGMAAGDYTVISRNFDHGRPEIVSEKRVSVRSGADPAVSDQALAAVAGRVIFNPPDRPPEIQISLFSVAGGISRWQQQVTAIRQDGSFQFDSPGVPAGRYNVQLMNAPEFRIANLAAKGAKYDGAALEISPGSSVQLSVIAAKAEARVEGIVLKDGKPFAGAMVLLLPADQNTGAYTGRDQSDSDGSFSIDRVPAGRYLLLAIDDGRDLAYHDPSVMEPYRKQAQIITVPVVTNGPLKIDVLSRKQ